MATRVIKVPAGAGDSVWLMQKLINVSEKFNFYLPDGHPRRGKQIFDLLPQVAVSATYIPGLSYRILAANNIQIEFREWKQVKAASFHLSCNDWLERGHRLEGFFPDLPLSFKLPWVISPAVQTEALNDFPLDAAYIGIYGSSYSTARAWKEFGAWGMAEWFALISLIHKERPNAKFVIIGASWDLDFAGELQAALIAAGIPYINTVGKELAYVMEVMKILSYAFYFPSGLPILSETIVGASDCLMFYGSNLTKMMGSWCNPERRADHRFKECLFCSPEGVHDWIKDVYCLYDKI